MNNRIFGRFLLSGGILLALLATDLETSVSINYPDPVTGYNSPRTITVPKLVSQRTNYMIMSGALVVAAFFFIISKRQSLWRSNADVITSNRENENAKGIAVEDNASAMPNLVTEELLKLHDLKTKGALSEEEFTKLKSTLLNS